MQVEKLTGPKSPANRFIAIRQEETNRTKKAKQEKQKTKRERIQNLNGNV